jgi:putative phosphoribosyl transferase
MAMFEDRSSAGFLLAEQITQKGASLSGSIVCGIARGGVVVASVIARILDTPLLPLAVKKITLPEQEELAVGAMSPGDIIYWDRKMVSELDLSRSDLALLASRSEDAYKLRETLLKPYMKLASVRNKTVILVDDGIATGTTVKAAALSLKKYKAGKLVLAVPVIAEEVYNELSHVFADMIVLSIAEEFHAVGAFYESFAQISDEDLLVMLKEYKQ